MQLVFHLHRLDDDDGLPLFDRLTDAGHHSNDAAGHRRLQAPLALTSARGGESGFDGGFPSASYLEIESAALHGGMLGATSLLERDSGLRRFADDRDAASAVADREDLVLDAIDEEPSGLAFALDDHLVLAFADSDRKALLARHAGRLFDAR